MSGKRKVDEPQTRHDPVSALGKGLIKKADALEQIADENAVETNPVNEHNLQEADSEILFEYLLGDDMNGYLTDLYKGRATNKLGGFRWSLGHAISEGTFVIDSVPKDTPARTGNDESEVHPVNRRIRALCGFDVLTRIRELGRANKINNVSALRLALKAARDRMGL